MYTCTASNRFGKVNKTSKLTVRRKTYIAIPPTDARIYQGDQIKLRCTAFTDPILASNLTISTLRHARYSSCSILVLALGACISEHDIT